jgi:hypothetical protein
MDYFQYFCDAIMKDLLILIIEFIGGTIDSLPDCKNPKKTILITFGLFFIVIAIVYYLTKDFK